MRLTYKDREMFLTKQPFTEMLNKLGQLEDIMEKYGINSAEELEHIILNDATGEQSFKDYIKPYKDIEKELGVDLVTFLKGVNPNTCFMEITKDKKFDFCGDAYHGTYSKEGLLKLIQELLFMYWALTKEELE